MVLIALKQFRYQRQVYGPGDVLPARACRWVDLRAMQRGGIISKPTRTTTTARRQAEAEDTASHLESVGVLEPITETITRAPRGTRTKRR